VDLEAESKCPRYNVAVRKWVTLLALTVFTAATSYAADTLPARISDETFWQLVETLSEPSGTFQFENLLSNETDFPFVMSELKRTAPAGGVYLGVGPEQNFNYIAAIRPKIAFIIDIRRQNMLEHLIYKALFELSPDRAGFVSRLFSRKRPPGLTAGLTAAELFDAYSNAPPDETLFETNLRDIQEYLVGTRHFVISPEDRDSIEKVYAAFREFGPLINYNSRGGGFGSRGFTPSYTELMTETDFDGQEWSYLAREADYLFVRDLEIRNLIVPLTGDFGGPGAIRAVGQYLWDHNAVVSAFYTSNVEGYLFQGGDRNGNPNGGAERFYENVATLPLDEASTFIRWVPGAAGRNGGDSSVSLAPIQQNLDDFSAGRFTAGSLLFARQPFARQGNFRGFLNNGPRRSFPAQRLVWVARLRILFYLSWTVLGFSLRYFVWRPAEEREGLLSPRRILHSLAWGAVGLMLAAVLGVLAHV
jgi:hypothetical protein